jgi:hypothetical protein
VDALQITSSEQPTNQYNSITVLPRETNDHCGDKRRISVAHKVVDERMSEENVRGECQRRMSEENVRGECQRRMSEENVSGAQEGRK